MLIDIMYLLNHDENLRNQNEAKSFNQCIIRGLYVVNSYINIIHN